MADAASVPLQDPSLPLWHGLLPALVLFCLEALLSWSTMKSVRLRRLLCGKPSFLMVDGVIDEEAMRRARFTLDELAEELRSHDVTDPASVRYAVLETDGSLNVVLRPGDRPPSAAQLGLPEPEDPGYGTILLQEGRVLSENLRRCGKNEAWLKRELKRRGCSRLEDAYAFILFESGAVYFQKRGSALPKTR